MYFRYLSFAVSAILLASAVHSEQLEGKKLRCCTLIEAPNVFRDNTHPLGYNGVAINYLNRLTGKLGFSCSTFEEYRDGNLTGFTDFIYTMQECTINGKTKQDDPRCKCDLGAAGFAINTERIGRVDFVADFANDDYRVFTHVANTASSTGDAFFLTTFSAEAWLAILSLAILFTFLKLLDKRFSPPDAEFEPLPKSFNWFKRQKHYILKSKLWFRLRKALESTLYKMIGNTSGEINGDGGSTRQRVLNFVTVLSGLFLVLAYEATMTASLVQDTIVSEFRTVEDLKNCRIPPEDVCIPGGGAVHAFWDTAISKGNPCHDQGPDAVGPTVVPSYDELFEKTAKKECKFSLATGSTTLFAVNGKYCGRLVVTGQPFLLGGTSFVLPKGSPYTENMSNATLQMNAEGSLPSVDETLSRQGECRVNITPVLTFKKLRIFFYLAYGACFLILLEMVMDPQTVRKNEDRNNTENGQLTKRQSSQHGSNIM